MNTSQIYLINYDNGQDYGDHDITPVVAVDTEQRAIDIAAEMNAWLVAKRAAHPEPVLKQYESAKKYEAWQKTISGLVPPYCAAELVDDLLYSHGGSVTHSCIPFYESEIQP